MRKMYPVVRPPQSDDEDVWRRLWTAYLDFYQTEIPPEATQRTWERILDPRHFSPAPVGLAAQYTRSLGGMLATSFVSGRICTGR